jgi:hypothetical protein
MLFLALQHRFAKLVFIDKLAALHQFEKAFNAGWWSGHE